MIYNDELAASLDQIDGVVVFHRMEQSEVQRLAQQLAEKAVGLVEGNEKVLDQKLGGGRNEGQSGDREGGGGRGRTERRGGTRGKSRNHCFPRDSLASFQGVAKFPWRVAYQMATRGIGEEHLC